MRDALKRGTEARLQQSAIVAALVLVHEYSGKQPKTASRFAVIRVAEPAAVQDFRRERDVAR
jgi:hypothetical protein